MAARETALVLVLVIIGNLLWSASGICGYSKELMNRVSESEGVIEVNLTGERDCTWELAKKDGRNTVLLLDFTEVALPRSTVKIKGQVVASGSLAPFCVIAYTSSSVCDQTKITNKLAELRKKHSTCTWMSFAPLPDSITYTGTSDRFRLDYKFVDCTESKENTVSSTTTTSPPTSRRTTLKSATPPPPRAAPTTESTTSTRKGHINTAQKRDEGHVTENAGFGNKEDDSASDDDDTKQEQDCPAFLPLLIVASILAICLAAAIVGILILNRRLRKREREHFDRMVRMSRREAGKNVAQPTANNHTQEDEYAAADGVMSPTAPVAQLSSENASRGVDVEAGQEAPSAETPGPSSQCVYAVVNKSKSNA